MTTRTNTNTADTDLHRQRTLDERRRLLHVGCIVCDSGNPNGLNLRCESDAEGCVTARFQPQPWMVGFTGQLHGGVVSALLDGAMTQCLFAHDELAVTAVMHIRFRQPAPLDRELQVRAWIDHGDLHRHHLRAQIRDVDCLVAEAEAPFIPRPDAA